ncbi:chromosome segregation protein SMC [Ligilactobacillus equi]|nr:chromosome segregation protein SMC [Ligilactobacillus equi]
MKLTALTITGFKSFAQKTRIEFQPGMTGIVGPNGSGKSNVVEALRFVLGEHSAKSLRGGRMADVIFAGSSKRSPLNRAEVRIELDNSDGFLAKQPESIEIIRRLYRDGSGEYLLNNKTVRMRDITELFMDTGIGRESFSIISQGRVEEIFNSKPQDRRGLVEEVAGVLKYKKEKQHAQKQLDETSDHLQRVADIITELYQQRQPLEEQASIARDYLDQKKRYDHFNLSRLVLNIESNQAKHQDVLVQVEANQKLVADYEIQSQKANKAMQDLQTQQSKLEESLDQKQNQLLEVTNQMERLYGQQKISQQDQAYKQEKLAELSQQETNLQAQVRDITAEITRVQATVTDLEAQASDLQRKLTNLKAQAVVSPTDLRRQEEVNRQKTLQVMQTEANLVSQLEYLKREQAKQSDDLVADQAALKEIDALYQAEAQKEAQAQTNLAEIEGQHAQAKAKEKASLEATQVLQRRLEEQEKRYYQANDVLKQAQTREETLKRVALSHQGYYQGVKNIMQAQKKLVGIIGPVAQLLQADQTYSLALETALGAQLQNVVVTDTQAAKQAINYLRKQKLGRATFLPCDALKPKRLSAHQLEVVATTPGIIGVASDLVQINVPNPVVTAYLLGATVIAENLDAATILAQKLNHSVKIVTLQGDLLASGGAMTGGQNKQAGMGLLEQRNQLEKLQKDVGLMQEKLATMQNMGQKTRQELEVQQAQSKQATLTVVDLSQKLTQAQQEHQLASVRLKYQAEQRAKLLANNNLSDDFLNDYEAKLHDLEAQLAQTKQAKAELSQEANQLQANLQASSASYEGALKKQGEIEQKLAVVKERLTSQSQRLADLSKQKLQLETTLAANQTEVANLEKVSPGPTEGKLQVQLDELEAKQADLQATIAKLKEARTGGKDEQVKAQLQVNRLGDLQRAALDEQANLAVRKSQIQGLLKNDLDELANSYAMTYEAASQDSDLNRDLAYVNQQIRLLKLGLEDLGEVNLGAIKEFDRINERYEFLTKQQDDLLNAKEQLIQSMDEMDAEVKKRFLATFNAISASFENVFPQMFGGGYAKLQLTDPDDPLTTGIEIMAQPPGKKFQTLSLLSGGEKALTAMALLFAILKVHPVPFVILDEAEAALDDANVQRYAQYLQNFDSKTQFIVITHRKGTMMNADVLYGVTMQESGVSSVVSVAVKDDQEERN